MKQLIFTTVMMLISMFSIAQIPPVDENGLAIGGYDVVAYFNSQPTKGTTGIAYQYEGATYQFANKANRDLFRANPTKYLPQFGGYCAWGVAAKEAKFPINPETYDIIDGKLYLFFNGDFNGDNFNTSLLWNQETASLKTAAHKNWPKVKSK